MSEGYSIYTLWGEPAWEEGPKQPVEVAVPDSLFVRPIWKVVVEKEDGGGQVVQRDVTEGLTLGEALVQKENLVRGYRGEGYITLNNLNLYPPGGAESGGKTVIFLDVEAGEENEKSRPQADVGKQKSRAGVT